MADPLKKILQPIRSLQNIRGVELPIGLEFLQLVVTGPPGAGKSYYIEQIRGWPNEGYLDLTQRGWWKDQSLIYRPREVHLGLPFKGITEALTVFDKEWLNNPEPLQLELERIVLPPFKNNPFQTDWRSRYIFEFLIPGPTTIYQRRLARQQQGYFPVDDKLSLEMVRQQVSVYREVALYLNRAGLNVYLRKGLDKPPMWIAEQGVANVPPWTLDNKAQNTKLKSFVGWRYLFRRHHPIQWLSLTSTPQEIKTACRIAHDGRSFELQVGDVALRLQPEIALGIKKKAMEKNWIITTEESCATRNINGFVRIRVAETTVIGRTNRQYEQLFHLDETVAKRHLSISNRKGDLILAPLSADKSTSVVRLDDSDYRERLAKDRHKTLLEIRRLYGQEISPLPARSALTRIRAVNELLINEPMRPKNLAGNPGGLVELPNNSTPVIVGDLHAQVDNLLKILSENCLLDCLRLKTATLILLGDAVHSEVAGEMDNFVSSMLMMDLIFMLKLSFPENVFYLRGNHDSFDPEINKCGVLQGERFKEILLDQRGPEYVGEMEKFYLNLPFIITSSDFIACHAGPPAKKSSREDFIEIKEHSQLARTIITTRIKRPDQLSGYKKSDIKKLRQSLSLPGKTRVIVGHTPMDPFGSYWMHAGSIKNHHIIYSAHSAGASIIIRTEHGFMPISFPAEPLTEFINNL
jgi:hypothetical protein